jgi:hypothetical protein
LNIEGLAPTPEGHLLIGFRNPIPQGKALLIQLLNPQEVTAGRKAVFGPQIFIDLKGLGIRSITPHDSGYLIVAGPYDGDGISHLYRWDGTSRNPVLIMPGGLAGNPEGIAVIRKNTSDVLFALSDDGTVKVGAVDCKKLKDDTLKVFRGYEMPLAVPETASRTDERRNEASVR